VEQVAYDLSSLRNRQIKVAKSSKDVAPRAPTIVENLADNQTSAATEPTEISANHLSTLERGLAKRQSKGKYQFLQHPHVESYGRGVSMEAESPPPPKRPIGGPQPAPEASPVLFDKAKKYIMKYPEKLEDSDEDSKENAKRKKKDPSAKWLKTQDPDVGEKSNTVTPVPARRGSVPPRTPPGIKSDGEEGSESDYDEEESEEESEEEESEELPAPRPSAIIGFRTINPIGAGMLRQSYAM
jgi:hypothetical protein